jgi:hypothetical protein
MKRKRKKKSKIALKEKIHMGGKNSAKALRQMRKRDFDLNKGVRAAGEIERKRLSRKNLDTCPLCKKRKKKQFKLCYRCNTKRARKKHKKNPTTPLHNPYSQKPNKEYLIL